MQRAGGRRSANRAGFGIAVEPARRCKVMRATSRPIESPHGCLVAVRPEGAVDLTSTDWRRSHRDQLVDELGMKIPRHSEGHFP